MVFYATTQVFFESEGHVRVIPKVVLLDAPDPEAAADKVEAWLDESYPGPAYSGHEYDVKPLDGVTMLDDEFLELAVLSAPFPIVATVRQEPVRQEPVSKKGW
jgi:hypothetical protein